MAFQTKGAQLTSGLLKDVGNFFAKGRENYPEGMMGQNNPMSQDQRNFQRFNTQPKPEPRKFYSEPRFSGEMSGLNSPYGGAIPWREQESGQSGLDKEIAQDTRQENVKQLAPVIKTVAQKRKAATQGSSLHNAGPEQGPQMGEPVRGPASFTESNPVPQEAAQVQSGLAPKETERGFFGSIGNKIANADFGRIGFGILDDVAETEFGQKIGALDNYEKGLRRKAFNDAIGEDGKLDKRKLVSGLAKSGFGDDALKIQNENEKLEKGFAAKIMAAQEKAKIVQEKITRGQALKEEAIAKGFPYKEKADGSVEVDFNKLPMQKEAREAAKQYYETGTGQRLPSNGSISGQAPTRGIASIKGGVEQEALPAEGTIGGFRKEEGPNLKFKGTLKQQGEQSIQERKDSLARLKSEEISDVDLGKSFDNIETVKELGGKLEFDSDGKSYGIKSKVGTGPIAGPMGGLYPTEDRQQLEQALNAFSFGEKARMLKGMSKIADSDREAAQMEKAFPNVKQDKKVIHNIATTYKTQLENAQDMISAKKQYVNQHGTDQGFNERWRKYKDNNQKIIRDKNGIIVPTETDIPYEQYQNQAAQGAKPLPIDLESLKGKFVHPKVQSPLTQDKNLPSKLKDDQMYITKWGPKSGAQLKQAIKLIEKKEGGGE